MPAPQIMSQGGELAVQFAEPKNRLRDESKRRAGIALTMSPCDQIPLGAKLVHQAFDNLNAGSVCHRVTVAIIRPGAGSFFANVGPGLSSDATAVGVVCVGAVGTDDGIASA